MRERERRKRERERDRALMFLENEDLLQTD